MWPPSKRVQEMIKEYIPPGMDVEDIPPYVRVHFLPKSMKVPQRDFNVFQKYVFRERKEREAKGLDTKEEKGKGEILGENMTIASPDWGKKSDEQKQPFANIRLGLADEEEKFTIKFTLPKVIEWGEKVLRSRTKDSAIITRFGLANLPPGSLFIFQQGGSTASGAIQTILRSKIGIDNTFNDDEDHRYIEAKENYHKLKAERRLRSKKNKKSKKKKKKKRHVKTEITDEEEEEEPKPKSKSKKKKKKHVKTEFTDEEEEEPKPKRKRKKKTVRKPRKRKPRIEVSEEEEIEPVVVEEEEEPIELVLDEEEEIIQSPKGVNSSIEFMRVIMFIN